MEQVFVTDRLALMPEHVGADGCFRKAGRGRDCRQQADYGKFATKGASRPCDLVGSFSSSVRPPAHLPGTDRALRQCGPKKKGCLHEQLSGLYKRSLTEGRVTPGTAVEAFRRIA